MGIRFRLSDLEEVRTSRRSFVAGATGALASALAACGRGQGDGHREGEGGGVAHAPNGDAPGPPAAVPPAPANRATYVPRSAEVPPPSAAGTVALHFEVRDVNFAITPDLVVPVWTFEGQVPGPIVRVRQGARVDFTLTNRGTTGHSMDFHAAQVNPKVAFRTIAPGQSLSYSFTPKYAGAFMYHCGTAPVLMHIGMGMYGALIVDPPDPLPKAREFVLVEGEYYVDKDASGRPALSLEKMLETLPSHLAFNGHPFQYQQNPLRVRVGELVRFYVVNAGPSQDCAFHVVGEQFDTVYLGAPPGTPLRGVQTFLVPAGGGMVFELMADVPGEFVFVNHKFGHGQKGAMGVLVVE